MEHTKRFAANPSTRRYYPAGDTKGHGCLLHLPTHSGAEMWAAVNAKNDFLGMDPHFDGPSRLPMRLTEKTWHSDSVVTTFVGSVETDNGIGGDNEVPLTLEFDCPYSIFGEDMSMPILCTVQLAAFAHEITVYDTLKHYEKDCEEVKASGGVPFDDHSFFWTRIFHKNANDAGIKIPRSMAVFTGHVVRSDVKINEQTGEYFYWALVETRGGCQFDVVIHPHLIDHHKGKGQSPPRAGCIVQGHFWLSGRLIDEYLGQ